MPNKHKQKQCPSVRGYDMFIAQLFVELKKNIFCDAAASSKPNQRICFGLKQKEKNTAIQASWMA